MVSVEKPEAEFLNKGSKFFGQVFSQAYTCYVRNFQIARWEHRARIFAGGSGEEKAKINHRRGIRIDQVHRGGKAAENRNAVIAPCTTA
ncbi:hypothetical protein DBV15_01800 [Temnothorax longispinosus]|uniref:Uncharacterized protein n=1 Tax=Temnothorax longispinosus TaxID=300112 RepID=A0A4S2KMA6_9HYME|nr:hypothetical protein DBV15_01800 [Temnothorax longispinosus]